MSRSVLLIFSLILGITWASAPNFNRYLLAKHSNTPKSTEDYLLPENLEPEWYEISIIPYLEEPADKNFTFEGTVKIKVQVNGDTNNIIMHSYQLNITGVAVINDYTGTAVEVTDFDVLEDDRQFLNITLGKVLSNGGLYVVEVNFTGSLVQDNLLGLHRAAHRGQDDSLQWMVVTQFQPVHARRAFPCFDEPRWKAKFGLRVAHAPNFTVLSNLPASTVPEKPLGDPALPDWSWSEFPRSASPVAMSTYLVAFSVSQLAILEHSEAPLKLRLWAEPGREHLGQLALKITPPILGLLGQYMDHTYDLPKLDQLALPEVPAGAMENWGLVVYRDVNLLHEAGETSSSQRQFIEAGIAHELTHQWLGNLVTPDSWSHLWLSEGFAAFFEFHLTDLMEPSWEMDAQFVVAKLHPVLLADSFVSTPPMEVQVDSPQSIQSVFNILPFFKGASLIRYLVYLMGEDNFRSGLQNYVQEMRGFNAVPADLWRHLGLLIPEGVLPSDLDLAKVMDPWLQQPGYPVVKVTRSYDGSGIATLSQYRFLLDGDSRAEVWWVPVTFTGENNTNFDDFVVSHWLYSDAIDVNTTLGDEQWLVVNLKQAGYYRVNYDPPNWSMLCAALLDPASALPVFTRAQLLDDALALARGGLLEYRTALEVTAYLGVAESELVPWTAALTALTYLQDRLVYRDDSSAQDEHSTLAYRWYLIAQLSPMYPLINGFLETPDDSHLAKLKRSLILTHLCGLEEPRCTAEGAAIFSTWRQQEQDPDLHNPISPDLRSAVYCSGARSEGREAFEFLMARYLTTVTRPASEKRAVLLASMGCVQDPAILLEYLQLSITPGSGIEPSDARSVFTAVYSNWQSVDLALNFMVNNWTDCLDVYGGPEKLGLAFIGISEKCNTVQQRTKLNSLMTDPEMPEETRAMLISAVLTVEENLNWHERYRADVMAFLDEKRAAAAAHLTKAALLSSCLLPLLLAVVVR